jgi:hypothetical protein
MKVFVSTCTGPDAANMVARLVATSVRMLFNRSRPPLASTARCSACGRSGSLASRRLPGSIAPSVKRKRRGRSQ